MKNTTKRLLLTIGLTLTVVPVSFAGETVAPASSISGNLSLANNYVWRGMSQHADTDGVSDKKITLSGGLDYDIGKGFALGIWASNVSSGKSTDGSKATTEVDYYGSYSGDINEDTGYEVGYISYTYPGQKGNDFEEAYLGLTYNDFGLTYYNGRKQAADYLEGSYAITLSDIEVSLTAGKYSDKDDGTGGYKVYGLSLGKSYDGWDYSIGYTKKGDSTGSTTDSENNTVFGISKSF